MTKILASKGAGGTPVSARYTRDDETPKPGEIEVTLPADVDIGPWVETVVWDDDLGRPREPSPEENLASAKAAKRAELERRLDEECRKIFPSVYVGIIVVSEQKSDPRSIQIRSLIANYNSKIQTLESPQTDTIAEVEAITF